MAVSITHFLVITIFMASLNGSNGQLVTTVVGVQDIITLLENITDTSTTTSMFLPHLARLLKNQEDVQLLTNLLLQNSTDTCSVDKVASILRDIMDNQNGHFNQSISTQIRMEDLLDQMVNTQIQMANALTQSVGTQNCTEVTLYRMAITQTQMASALTQNGDTQNLMEDSLRQIANTQTQMASALNESVDTQNRMEATLDHIANTQTRMEATLDRMANTQTQMANAFTQSVNIQNRTEAAINQMANTQTQMANAFTQSVNIQNRTEATINQMANTQTKMANALTHSVNIQNCTEATLDQTANTQLVRALIESLDTQNRTEVTFDQIANTLTQSVDTQNRMEATLDQMANTLTQVANIMQMQSEQFQNMTSTMTYMVGQLDTQNQFISHLPTDIPKDCSDLASQAPHPSGPYTIRPWDELGNMHVYCDMDTDGNGWTVFQRRFDGSVDFYRGWDDYENGFGSPDGEHWLGLRQIYRLTRQGSWTLRIDLEDFQGNTAYAVYQSFSVGDAQSYYRLSIGAYSGTAGDSLTEHGHNQAFTTKDSDNDGTSTENCAVDRQGAWWYKDCNYSNLNGLYLGPSQDTNTGMTWHHWKDNREVLKTSVMKIQRIN